MGVIYESVGSRMNLSSENEIITFKDLTFKYKDIIENGPVDLSFYPESQKGKGNNLWTSNANYPIYLYSGDDYIMLNDYLRKDVINEKYTESQLKSWVWLLHSAIIMDSNNSRKVNKDQIVYKGINKPSSNIDWKIGDEFCFAEFLSTSKNFFIAKRFALGNIILVIRLRSTRQECDYCKYIEDITQYKGEEEVLINPYCLYKVKKIKGNTFYLDCYGEKLLLQDTFFYPQDNWP